MIKGQISFGQEFPVSKLLQFEYNYSLSVQDINWAVLTI